MEIQTIQNKIYQVRGKSVMLDADLAGLYQVETRVLKQAVRRNIERFPADFMFEITPAEYATVRESPGNALSDSVTSQNVTSKSGGTRYMPFAFTQEGVAMLSGILRSPVAIQINIGIMRAFVAMREMLIALPAEGEVLKNIRERLEALEKNREEALTAVNDLSEDVYREIDEIFLAMTQLSERRQKESQRNPIGYKK